MLWSGAINPSGDVLIGGEPSRDRAVRQAQYADECERWLDHWYRGSAQRERLKDTIIARTGWTQDPRKGGENTDAEDVVLNEDGRLVRSGLTELLTFGYARKVAQDLGVLYASDDLERIYLDEQGERDQATTDTLAWYHDPERGALGSWLNLLDAWLVGLRMVGLRVEWVPELGELSYEVLPPHWFHIWPHDRFPRSLRLAYAIAYAEPEAYDEYGRPVAGNVYTAYVRPALPSDPPNAPTRMPGYEATGRVVRYMREGHPWADPFPLPNPNITSDEIMRVRPDGGAEELYDYPNWLVEACGWAPDQGRFIWQPMVVHYAEPPVENVRLPVADHHSRTNEELDAGLTIATHTANEQLFGQPVYRGGGSPPKRIGPSYPVHVKDTAGAFTFESTGAQPGAHLDVLHKIAKVSGAFEHLPADTFDYQPPSIETGPAKLLRRAELIQERSRRAIDAVRPEVRRFQLERVLHNRYGVEATGLPPIPWTTRLQMHWGELAVPVDWNRRLDEMVKERALGLTSTVDLIAERHGVSREDAERRLKDISGAADQPAAPPGEQPAAGAEGTAAPAPAEGEPAEPATPDQGKPTEANALAADADTAFTGIQTEKLEKIIIDVAAGILPPDSAIELILMAYPADRAAAERLVNPAIHWKLPTPEPAASDRPKGATGGAGPDRGDGDEDIGTDDE